MLKNHEALADNHCALAAVEMALLDALTRYLKIPLWRLWGDRQKKLSSDVTIVIAYLTETKEKATFFYAQGFRSFKIKIGLDQDLDFKRIAAVDKSWHEADDRRDGRIKSSYDCSSAHSCCLGLF